MFLPLCCALLLVGFWPAWASAESLTLNDRQLWAEANSLYAEGEYFRAITGYKRYLFHFPQAEQADQARLQVARALLAGGDLPQAVTYLESWLQKLQAPHPLWIPAHRLAALALLDQRQQFPFPLRQPYVEQAMEHLRQTGLGPVPDPLLPALAQAWQQRTTKAPQNTWVAGGLSALVPGAGSAYSGRWIEGAYAFLITGLFAGAALEAQKDGRQDLALGLGFFGLAFYGGNIYVAVNSAHRVNDQLPNQELFELRRRYGLWFSPREGLAP